jgi:hypothetical protein
MGALIPTHDVISSCQGSSAGASGSRAVSTSTALVDTTNSGAQNLAVLPAPNLT